MAAYEIEAPDVQKAADSKKISFRFCRECSNMLYPKEDRLNNTLMFACRTCTFSEPAGASCIYRNSLKETIAETPGNVQDVAQDPTVGEPNSFPFDDSASALSSDTEELEGMDSVPEACTLCGAMILCPICENPTDQGVILETEDPEEEVQEMGEEVVEVEVERRKRSLSGGDTKQS